MFKKCDFYFCIQNVHFYVTGVPEKFRISHSNSRHVKNLSTPGLEEPRDIVKQALGYSRQPNIRTGKPLNRHRLHQCFRCQMNLRQNRLTNWSQYLLLM